MNNHKICIKTDCIIPAAGKSSRMGTWKPALRWGRGTILTHTADQALSAGCRVIVVCGNRANDLKALLKHKNVLTAESARWYLGMDESVRAALPLLESDWFFIIPGDMPFVCADDYRRLSEQISYGDEVIRPEYNGIPGHPVLTGQKAAGLIKDSAPGTPLRYILRTCRTRLIRWSHSGVIQDLDTQTDYQAHRS